MGSGARGAGLTWTHTEDLVEVGADAHLLVELGGLGQVGAGFKVRHGEDVCTPLTGSWKTEEDSSNQFPSGEASAGRTPQHRFSRLYRLDHSSPADSRERTDGTEADLEGKGRSEHLQLLLLMLRR